MAKTERLKKFIARDGVGCFMLYERSDGWVKWVVDFEALFEASIYMNEPKFLFDSEDEIDEIVTKQFMNSDRGKDHLPITVYPFELVCRHPEDSEALGYYDPPKYRRAVVKEKVDEKEAKK